MPKKMRMWVEKDEYGELPELTEEKRVRLREKAVNYCLWSLGQSDKTRKQLFDKMARKNCPEDIIEDVLDEMESRQYLDDESYAKYFAKSKMQSSRGGNYIRQALREKGIEPETISETLEEVDPEEEFENALEYGDRIWYSLERYEDKWERKRRFTTKLSRRGYDFDVCNRVYTQLLEDHAEDE